MTTTRSAPETVSPSAPRWYARGAPDVAAAFGVDPAVGLYSPRAAELLRSNGPNALPEEKPKPGWRRFVDQYRSYMQLILVGAAIVSLAIKEWSTAVLLVIITLLNAVVGLRQEGKAESAMNALKSMMKITARVRRDGVESEIPAEQVVTGDVVLLAAGDEVPADGRIIEASALQIDESALTGESTPAQKETTTLADSAMGPGDQVNMAFMNTPVTHGSGVMIVTGTATADRAREDLGDALGDGHGAVTADQGAQPADAVDRRRRRLDDDRDVRPRALEGHGLGRPLRQRGLPRHRRHPRGAADGDPGDPVARQRGAGQAQRTGQGAAGRRDARVHVGHQLRQDRHPHDEPDDRGRGHRSDRPLHRSPARATASRAGSSTPLARPTPSRTPSCPSSSPTTPSWSTARWSATPPRGRCWSSATRPASTSTPPVSACRGWPRCPSTPPTS